MSPNLVHFLCLFQLMQLFCSNTLVSHMKHLSMLKQQTGVCYRFTSTHKSMLYFSTKQCINKCLLFLETLLFFCICSMTVDLSSVGQDQQFCVYVLCIHLSVCMCVHCMMCALGYQFMHICLCVHVHVFMFGLVQT